MNESIFYFVFPAILTYLGGFFGLFKFITPFGKSCLQHLAAGMIFCAVAIELIPLHTKFPNRFFLILGFLTGLFLTLALKLITHTVQSRYGSKLSWAFPTAIGVDFFIDGFFIGISMFLGAMHGSLITFAIIVEMIFLSIVTTTKLHQHMSIAKTLVFLLILVAIIPLSTILGKIFVEMADSVTQSFMLSFGVSALLYLVTEELLRNVHLVTDKVWTTAIFFLGFFVIYLMA